MSNAPIGIFDSGHGGLTVLVELQKKLPYENIIYFGDLARVPYGNKTPQEIIQINFEIISFLNELKVKTILMACNTSSAIALEEDLLKFPQTILGLIQPVAAQVIRVTQNKKVGVFATEATVKSGAYQKYIQQIDPEIEVLEIACSEFVPIIEDNQVDEPKTEKIIQTYMQKINEFGADTLIHGCSHYPFLQNKMSPFAKNDLKFLDPAVSLVEQTKKVISLQEELNDQTQKGQVIFYQSYLNEKGEYAVRQDETSFKERVVKLAL